MKIALRPEERSALYQLLSKYCQGWVATRARALLLSDLGNTDEEISHALHIGKTFLLTVKKHYFEGGLIRALYLSAAEATLVALAVKPPDTGEKKWTLNLLAERAQLLGIRMFLLMKVGPGLPLFDHIKWTLVVNFDHINGTHSTKNTGGLSRLSPQCYFRVASRKQERVLRSMRCKG